MYAGGWITHSTLHMPALRPVVRPRVQSQLVCRPVPATPVETVPVPVVPFCIAEPTAPIPLQPVETITQAKQTKQTIGIHWWLLVLLVVVSGAYHVKQLGDVNYYKSAVVSAQDMLKHAGKKASTVMRAVDAAELRCMSENIYFEAGGESLAGKLAVGQVVLNRVKNPSYPKTVCGVVHQKNGDTCQFSWLCEDAKTVKESHNWRQSQEVAYRLLSRDVDDITEGSTNFHGISVNPKWNLKPTVKIDGHQFYR